MITILQILYVAKTYEVQKQFAFCGSIPHSICYPTRLEVNGLYRKIRDLLPLQPVATIPPENSGSRTQDSEALVLSLTYGGARSGVKLWRNYW